MKKEYIKSPMNYIGNKYRIINQIQKWFPHKIDTMVDLFCGGGNVTVNVEAKRIIGNDFEKHVIGIYQYLKTHNIDEIITQIEEIVKEITK